MSAALHVRHLGQGPRPVLALHCTMAHSGAWKGLSAELGDLAHFTAPDMFNHGRSPDWQGPGDLPETMVAAMADLLPDAPVDLIGHSFGGLLAVMLALRDPARLRSLTLIEPVIFGALRGRRDDLYDSESAGMVPVFDTLGAGDPALAARIFNRRWGGGGERWPSLSEASRAAMTRGVQVLPEANGAIYHDAPGLTRPGALDTLTMPALVICGGATGPVMAAITEAVTESLPDARRIEVPGAGHMVPITHPRETAQAIRGLWDRAG